MHWHCYNTGLSSVDNPPLSQTRPMPQLLLNIDVSDLKAAERFYADAFGLQPARRLGSQVLEMHGAQCAIFLLSKPAGTRVAGAASRDYARHWTPIHVDWVVDDLEAALRQALAAGAVQEGAIRAADWGRIVQVADPFGHGWCLLQFSERGYDAIAS